ncbi:hypothetical protein GS4_32_01210 [Gordonia soli NBRC 108243]|uniref:ANTAR domain-containing protein n=1 Tax=Gordonia soli NBRC 108243 TaxID=1223545 RepID=M0QRL2_9ACTN|nr:hypothetical protein GS4_32_01210 [Gordonia soli NBRC 108243]
MDALQAFDILRRLSQDSNTALVDVAHQIVAADHPSPEPDQPVS